jgi:hypothetical protein
MSVSLSPIGGAGAQFFSNIGQPLAGGKIYTYAAGTSTPQTAYTTSAGNIAHSNPIVLDSSGRVPAGGEIWLTSSQKYKFVINDSSGNLIGTYDNISGNGAGPSTQQVQIATAGQTVFTLTGGMTYLPGANTLSVYIDGVKQYVSSAYTETNSTTVTFSEGLHVGALVQFVAP